MGQGTDVIGNRDQMSRDQMSRGQRDANNLARQGDVAGTDATAETAAIRGDIERTRAEMADTIDALQDKLDPKVVAGQVKEKVRTEARDRATRVAHAMRTGVIERMQQVQAKVTDTTAAMSQGSASPAANALAPWITAGQRQAQRAVERMRRLSEEDPGAYTALLVIAGVAVVGLVWIARSSDD